MISSFLQEFLANALREDIGSGDHTSLSCIPKDAIKTAELKIKEDGVLAGIEAAKFIFSYIDKSIEFEQFSFDSDAVKVGDIAFRIRGNAHSILKAERLALNIMQRMSGIATNTARYVAKVQHTHAVVLDTRKTTPGFRWFEKEAVRIGGGTNHRFGLFDMIMLKDNHIDYAGGIEAAITKANRYLKENNLTLKIEIECRNFNELETILKVGGIQRIMLDNFSVTDTRKAVEIIDSRYEIESSGGITLDTIAGYAECGVDFISVGALTHHVKSLDMSLKAA